LDIYRKEQELVEDFMANTSLKIGSRELQVADTVEYSSILGCDAALLGKWCPVCCCIIVPSSLVSSSPRRIATWGKKVCVVQVQVRWAVR